MEKPHVAIFPLGSAMGHLLPSAELANRLSHFPGFSITLIFSKWLWSSQQPAVLQRLASAAPDIRFTVIPHVTENEDEQKMGFQIRLTNFMLRAMPHIEDVLQSSLSSPSPISALIMDLFCTELLDLTAKLKIPGYVFNPASAAYVCYMLNFPKFFSDISGVSFKDASDFEVEIPGLPPIPARDLPSNVQEELESLFEWFLGHRSRSKKASGVLINTFEELEEEAIKTLRNSGTPPIYPIAPLFLTQSDTPDENKCLQWLDSQPPSSVLFVAFGSFAILSREQIIDLAIGLEASGHRFLWALRGFRSSPETEVSQLLPEGFESRTRDRGLVVLNWAPQIPILSHPSTGGFLSHCGWNSCLEGVCHGVPMIAWPLLAEQWLNKVILVKQIEVAIELEMEEGFVRREEVERAVRELMEGEGGRKAREKMREMKHKAKIAMMDGGSTMITTARAAADLSVST